MPLLSSPRPNLSPRIRHCPPLSSRAPDKNPNPRSLNLMALAVTNRTSDRRPRHRTMASRFGSRVLSSSCLIALLLLGIVAAENRRPKNIQVSLRAKWPGTSLLLEAGELLSKQSNDLFWEFTNLWLQPDRGSDCQTARCCVQKVVNDGRSLLSKHLGSIYEFSLTLRSASPRLVLYRKLAEDSLSSLPIDEEGSTVKFTGDESEQVVDPFPRGICCWVDTGSTLLFNVPELFSWLDCSSKQTLDSSEQPELFEFDHIYSDSNVAGPVAILYGALGTECFKDLHIALLDATKQGKVKYVVRPVLPIGCQAPASSCSAVGTSEGVNLGGYGVELALKNMEYKAMDDSAIKKGYNDSA